MLILPMLFGAFRPPKPEEDLVDRHLHGHEYIFCCIVLTFHPQVCAWSFNSGIASCPKEVQLLCPPPPPRAANAGPRWLKSSEQHG